MKRAILSFFVILSLVIPALRTSDDDCVWTYRCCKHQEINGEVQCVTMCEPDIHCPKPSEFESTDDDEESAALKDSEPDLDQGSLGSFFISLPIRRKGYQMHNGRCRRMFDRPHEAIKTNSNVTE